MHKKKKNKFLIILSFFLFLFLSLSFFIIFYEPKIILPKDNGMPKIINDIKNNISKIINLETEIEHKKTEIKTIQTEIEHKKTEIKTIQTEIEHKKTEIKNKQKDYSPLFALNQSLNSQKEKLENEKLEKEKQLKEFKSKIKSIKEYVEFDLTKILFIKSSNKLKEIQVKLTNFINEAEKESTKTFSLEEMNLKNLASDAKLVSYSIDFFLKLPELPKEEEIFFITRFKVIKYFIEKISGIPTLNPKEQQLKQLQFFPKVFSIVKLISKDFFHKTVDNVIQAELQSEKLKDEEKEKIKELCKSINYSTKSESTNIDLIEELKSEYLYIFQQKDGVRDVSYEAREGQIKTFRKNLILIWGVLLSNKNQIE
ncbi:hypothetical protein LFWB_6500 [Candidatus Phytoplasma luffae]|uniref:Uncharacterized protein n=1 Tax=Loofah witches'-broom phytoplasma TaxID=35773 RepID=A0A975FLK0_LOWBP|nr:hypothetical protein [Candidatus Phytoplasma luffae]QTX03211.1 hypothetical protein LFWB_6500 [Candidatus Phytoplasma luffae]